jgi:glycosyltransferase involved in cell wall biosynthesis
LPLGAALALGIEQSDSDFIALIDSDVEICADWFRKLIKYFEQVENLGAVEGVCEEACIYPQSRSRGVNGSQLNPIRENTNRDKINEPYFIEKRGEVTFRDILMRGFIWMVRGGMAMNVILRAEAAKNWAPPLSLHRFEDYHLTQYVLNKRFKWMIVPSVCSTHYGYKARDYLGKLRETYSKCLGDGAGIRVTNALSPFEIATYCFARIMGSFVKLISEGKVESFCRRLLTYVGLFMGYMRYQKYIPCMHAR